MENKTSDKMHYENFSLLSKEELSSVDHVNDVEDILNEYQLTDFKMLEVNS
jgi:hypothetical protein